VGTNLAIEKVDMSGRRSHARFEVLPSPEGVLRVLRDVVVQSTTPEHMVVISRQPSVLGELVSVQSPDGAGTDVTARVLESQPIIVDGSVRYQLRLHQENGASSGGDADNEPPRGTTAND
jgi:hypothetical protein